MDDGQIATLQREGGFERIDTHISWVLLGECAYKIKKPVRFSFLDFSTRQRREFFCGEEVRLNRRLSPDVYLGVVPVSLESGRLVLEGRGDAVDHAVKMRRLDGSRKMDALLEKGEVGLDVSREMAGIVAGFHGKADRRGGYNSPELLSAQVADLSNSRDVIERACGLGKWVDRLLSRSSLFIRKNAGLLRSRAEEGYVRDCHGDLHSGNVFLQDGIRIIDCVEFSEDFRCIDVASDVAFMAMDLECRGRPDLSDAFVEAYSAATGDPGLEALLPLYKCYRANVRAKIAAIDYQSSPTAEARGRIDRYVLMAERYAKSL